MFFLPNFARENVLVPVNFIEFVHPSKNFVFTINNLICFFDAFHIFYFWIEKEGYFIDYKFFYAQQSFCVFKRWSVGISFDITSPNILKNFYFNKSCCFYM